MSNVHIAVISDDGFMIPSIVMLTSAKKNKLPESRYVIHFVCCNVNSFYKRKLMELSAPDFEILLLEEDVDMFEQVNISIHVTAATFLKIRLPEILAGIDKIIHIDGDVVVQKDLTELYERNLEGNSLGVVRSMTMELSGTIQKRGIERGFNAGIMLMDLAKMRRERASSVLLDKLLTIPEDWNLLEQDVLNVVYHDDALYLPPRYNCFFFAFEKKYTIEEVNDFYGTKYVSFEDMNEDAVMVHLAGTPKRRPWQVFNGVLSTIWQHYYDQSPVAHVNLSRPLLLSDEVRKAVDGKFVTMETYGRYREDQRKQFVNVLQRLDGQMNRQDAQRKQIAEVERRLDGQMNRQDAQRKQIAEVERRLDGQINRQDAQRKQIAEVERRLDGQMARQDAQQQKQKNAQSQLDVHNKRIAKLKETLDLKLLALCPEHAFLLEVYEVVIARMKRRARRLKWLSLLCFGKKKAGYLEERRQLKKSISRVSAKLSAMQQ